MKFSKLHLVFMALTLSACEPMEQDVEFTQPPSSFAGHTQATHFKNDSIYFDAQSSEINSDDHKKLMAIAMQMRMNKILRARLVGSTEHATKNPSLALRRAIAVRNMLSQMGVTPGRIDVKDETHTDTILSQQHEESGDDANDRRVDIVIEAVVGQAI